MAEIDEAVVLSHGKALAAQDGFTWEIDFSAPRAGGGSFRGVHFLSKERQQEYLTRARTELHEEKGGA